MVVHAASVQPFLEDGVFQGDIRHPPVMRDAVKAGTAVARSDPPGRPSQRQHPMTLIDGVCRRSFQAAALRVRRGEGFRERLKGQQI
jgi:hypothetical protein